MSATRISPVTDDPESAPFFAAAAENRLVVRCCTDCGAGIFPASVHCPKCGSFATRWKDLPGTARLYTWSTIHNQVHPGYPTPYTVIIVQVDGAPGVKMPGMLPGVPPLQADMPMQVWFEKLPDGVVIPQWKPQ